MTNFLHMYAPPTWKNILIADVLETKRRDTQNPSEYLNEFIHKLSIMDIPTTGEEVKKNGMIPLAVRNLRMPHQENEIMAAKDFEELRKLVANAATNEHFRTKNGGSKRCTNHPKATSHTTEECKTKKAAAPQKQQTQNTEPMVCTYHPKLNNHTTENCGLNKKKSNLVSTRTTNVKPTIIELKVNGTNFKALVDTGCTQTTISKTCYERIGSPKPEGHVILLLADKSSKKCSTVMVTIEALGRTMKVTAAIMDTAPEHDVLLGLEELTQIYELKEKALGNDMDPRVRKAINENKNLTLEKPSKLTPFTLKLKTDVKPIHEQQIKYKPELHEIILKELEAMVKNNIIEENKEHNEWNLKIYPVASKEMKTTK